MHVSLTPELQQLVNDKVRSGMYQTASEVVQEALRLLRDRDQELARLRMDIRAGFDQVERGEYLEYDENTTKDLAGEIKTRGRQMLAKMRKTGTT